MSGEHSEQPFFMDVKRFRKPVEGAPVETTVVVMELIAAYGMHKGGTFRFHPASLENALNPASRKGSAPKEINAKMLEALKPYLGHFFIEVPDGRWALNPEIFSTVDGNPGAES